MLPPQSAESLAEDVRAFSPEFIRGLAQAAGSAADAINAAYPLRGKVGAIVVDDAVGYGTEYASAPPENTGKRRPPGALLNDEFDTIRRRLDVYVRDRSKYDRSCTARNQRRADNALERLIDEIRDIGSRMGIRYVKEHDRTTAAAARRERDRRMRANAIERERIADAAGKQAAYEQQEAQKSLDSEIAAARARVITDRKQRASSLHLNLLSAALNIHRLLETRTSESLMVDDIPEGVAVWTMDERAAGGPPHIYETETEFIIVKPGVSHDIPERMGNEQLSPDASSDDAADSGSQNPESEKAPAPDGTDKRWATPSGRMIRALIDRLPDRVDGYIYGPDGRNAVIQYLRDSIEHEDAIRTESPLMPRMNPFPMFSDQTLLVALAFLDDIAAGRIAVDDYLANYFLGALAIYGPTPELSTKKPELSTEKPELSTSRDAYDPEQKIRALALLKQEFKPFRSFDLAHFIQAAEYAINGEIQYRMVNPGKRLTFAEFEGVHLVIAFNMLNRAKRRVPESDSLELELREILEAYRTGPDGIGPKGPDTDETVNMPCVLVPPTPPAARILSHLNVEYPDRFD